MRSLSLKQVSTFHSCLFNLNAYCKAHIPTGLSTLTWILPDRFGGDSEFAIEAIHTTINLISTLHEVIAAEASLPIPIKDKLPVGSSELLLLLSALQHIQVLVEVWAIHKEDKGSTDRRRRYNSMVWVESMKAIVRMVILKLSKSRILTNGGLGNFDAWSLSRSDRDGSDIRKAFAAFKFKYGSALDASLHKVSADDKNAVAGYAEADSCTLRLLLLLGELSYILRPVVYTLALRQWGSRSWKPYLLSLAVELGSMKMTRSATSLSAKNACMAAKDPSVAGTSLEILYILQSMQLHREEMDELTRRKLKLVFYLVRDPFFSRITKVGLEKGEGVFSRIPLAGWATTKAVEIIGGAQQLYSYTAAS